MIINGLIHQLPKELKLLVGTFLVVLSVGFFSGIRFVNNTTGNTPKGIQENYLGNEQDESATVMKFKKTEREMQSVLHSHILSMSVIFFLLGLLVAITRLPAWLKKVLMIEPLLSVLFTFGGIYLMWNGHLFWRFVVMVSGIVMTLSYTISILLIVVQLLKKPRQI